MNDKQVKKFYLIREDVLPESVIKTLQIKDALKENPNLSIYEAVRQYGLSRSAFYKYKDTIFPIDEKVEDTREFTIILYVHDKVGMLAQVLNTISQIHMSVLTIHQSIPMEDKATITLSLNTAGSQTSIEDVIFALRNIENVYKVEIISMSM
ncbi:ACT domain-containing protein [Staphylococcus simulans]|uniref:ACT domain-containing protein n=1 Tax=Staphylococcus simulans TaxID=1286 RepID=UPI000D1D972F|nr:ACT domain-containing protein [Staphylococcus simulans]PTI87118.1 ACT domain-containing protein [Staphylococcus simulans]RIN49634.1 ACT domain-containing protein [Staphylococcus simulans]UXR46414.1 ACT domain-containing protein [Staphylococcus simulans]UXR53719.1 ACT domain-containing protein [Staphylococcus simulans]